MIDLFGRKRIAELEVENKILTTHRDELIQLSLNHDRLFWALHHIYVETKYGKSGTAQKVARMAKEVLRSRGDD